MNLHNNKLYFGIGTHQIHQRGNVELVERNRAIATKFAQTRLREALQQKKIEEDSMIKDIEKRKEREAERWLQVADSRSKKLMAATSYNNSAQKELRSRQLTELELSRKGIVQTSIKSKEQAEREFLSKQDRSRTLNSHIRDFNKT